MTSTIAAAIFLDLTSHQPKCAKDVPTKQLLERSATTWLANN